MGYSKKVILSPREGRYKRDRLLLWGSPRGEEKDNFSFGHVEIKILVGQSNALIQPPDPKFRFLLPIPYH